MQSDRGGIMAEEKTLKIDEFKERYGVNPDILVEVQKHGAIMFHPNYETLQEILFYNFEIDVDSQSVSFKEIVSTDAENPFFKIYEQNDKKFKKLINYHPDKKNTAVLEADNKEKY